MNADSSTNLPSSPVSVLDVSAFNVSSAIKRERSIKSNRTLPIKPPLAEYSPATTKKKSVRFFKRKRVRKIPHLCAMPDKIIEDCWFGPDDLDTMKMSNNSIVYLMDMGASDLVEQSEDSTRGLEGRTQDGAWNRYQHRQNAYDAVLDEQERQWTEDIEDPYIISHLYQLANKECTEIALERAESDESAIQDYLADN